LGASDPDKGDTLTFSIAGGADAADFRMNAHTGKMYFKESTDFEARRDANQDNIFEVVVKVSDGVHDTQQAVRIKIIDKPEAKHMAFQSVDIPDQFDFASLDPVGAAQDRAGDAFIQNSELTESPQNQHIFANDWLLG
jgi:uncharacterized lipoprotein